MRRFELVEGGSSKFWEVALDGTTVTVRFGRIGTNGQTQTKQFPDATKAAAEHAKLVREKTGKGYAEVQAANATLAPVAVKPPATKPVTVAAAPTPTPTPAPAAMATGTAPVITAPVVTPALPASESPAAVEAELAPAPAAAQRPNEIADPGPEPQPPGRFLWQAHWLRELAPWRGEALKPVSAADTGALFELVKIHLRKAIDSNLPLVTKIRTQLLELEVTLQELRVSPPEPLRWTNFFNMIQELGGRTLQHDLTLAHAWQLGASLHGLPFAVSQLQQQILKSPLQVVNRLILQPKLMAADELRQRIATATGADHESICKILMAPAEPLQVLVFAAYLLPTEAAPLEAALGAIEAATEVESGEVATLVESRLNAAQADRLLKLFTRCNWVSAPILRRFALSCQRAQLPRQSLEVLQRLSKAVSTPEDTSEYFALRRALDTPEALARLFTAQGRKEAQQWIDAFAHEWPELSLRLMAERLSGNRESQGQTWLQQFARAHASCLPAAIARCSGDARQLLQQLAAKVAPSQPEASMQALPEWLRQPPWRVRGRKARPAWPKLPQCTVAPAFVWGAGEREQWADGRNPETVRATFERNQPGRSWEPKACLGILGVVPEAMQRALEGSPLSAADLGNPRWRQVAPDLLFLLPPVCAAAVLAAQHPEHWSPYAIELESVVAWLDDAAVSAVENFAERASERGLELAQPLASVRIAIVAASALRNTRRARPLAQRWLLRHSGLATMALLPRLAESGSAEAAHALRWLLNNGRAEVVAATAASLGAEAMRAHQLLVEFDPMQLAPLKIPALPNYWLPAAYARPQLREGGLLPLECMDAIGEMLAFSSLDQRYEGIERLRALCTPRSLGAFAWDLLQSWLSAGAPMKQAWGFTALAQIGDDECAHGLAALLRTWPSEGAFGRAVAGLDVLAGMGSDVALMLLHGISQRVKSRPLQDRARQCLAQMGEIRGLSAEQLADRLVPDLDLDDNGSLQLDFGPRQFSVSFDEMLKPGVRDAAGNALKDLPGVLKSDDAELAAAATSSWKTLKKNVRTLATQQLQRLEQAMVDRRDWTLSEFRQFFVGHPLLRHLVRRLLWVSLVDGTPHQGFRVAEDLSFADHEDNSLVLPDTTRICLAHPLDLPASQLAAFCQIFADYQLLQPFAQLSRESFRLTPEEAAGSGLERYQGKLVATGSVFGLETRGWRRGDDTDGGWMHLMQRPLNAQLVVELPLDPGAVIGDVRSNPRQTLGALTLRRRGSHYDEGLRPWSQVPPVLASEVLRDIARMAAVKA